METLTPIAEIDVPNAEWAATINFYASLWGQPDYPQVPDTAVFRLGNEEVHFTKTDSNLKLNSLQTLPSHFQVAGPGQAPDIYNQLAKLPGAQAEPGPHKSWAFPVEAGITVVTMTTVRFNDQKTESRARGSIHNPNF
ncbi:hypothetical protein GCM10022408_01500 [Hymenobacter fastidiosus]|uniref:VOC family protein n=1 Tax=Hymenobacter fastidiosus TaxID=486264 RepID=A0ABP7RB32_9BACT